MNPHTLWVFDGVVRVGVITHDPLDDAFTFAYDLAWPQRENAYPQSDDPSSFSSVVMQHCIT